MRKTNGQRTLIVGDVHGCADEFDALLKVCGFDARGDKLILVGDLIAKGPDSRGVVERACELGASGVRGNHEEHVLRYKSASKVASPTAPAAAHRQVLESLCADHFSYLASFPYYLELTDLNVRVVHAGFDPMRPMCEQDAEQLTNMRSIDALGRPTKKLGDGRPWASFWSGPELAVFGHDAARKLQVYPHAIGLDTGCVYGGELTALELPSLRRFSVPARRVYEAVDA
jgi:hypothetical protein